MRGCAPRATPRIACVRLRFRWRWTLPGHAAGITRPGPAEAGRGSRDVALDRPDVFKPVLPVQSPAGAGWFLAHFRLSPRPGGGARRRRSVLSPPHGDPTGLQPLLIHVGECGATRDASVQFAHKANSAGVRVRLHMGTGVVHCYTAFASLFPEATHAMKIGQFVRYE